MTYRSATTKLDIPVGSYPEVVLHRATALGERPAFVDGPSGRTITYRQLAERSRIVAAALTARGMRKGDVLAIWLPNLPEFPLAFYGTILAGGVVTTVNLLYTPGELMNQLKDAHARYLLTLPQLLDGVRTILPKSSLREVFVLGQAEGAIPFAEFMVGHPSFLQPHINPASDVAALPYSSGTSGAPKGVMLTHRNLSANAIQVAAAPFDWVEREIVVGVPPMFHGYGISVYFGALMLHGATVITQPRFDLEQFLQIAQHYRATTLCTVPPVMRALAQHPLADKYDLSSVRKLTSGAAPLPEATARAVEQRLGAQVFEGYGMTELSGPTHVQAPGDSKRSVGRSLPGVEWKVVDIVTGADLPQGERGEIFVRGPNVMQGYLNRLAETAATIDAEGWLHTGDMGFADERGCCVIVDRLKELIKYKGYQVAPAELEELLLSHPQVADTCVIPRPDAEAGEVPKAFVVRKGEVAPEALMAFVAEKVAPYKRLRAVEFVDSLPRSPAGKLLRRVLIERERERVHA